MTSGRDGGRCMPGPAAGPPGARAGAAASRPAGRPRGGGRCGAAARGRRGAACPPVAGVGVVEQVEQPLAHQHVLPQRHRPVLVDHHGGVAAHGLDPAAELLGVADRRRQADQPHLLGQVQDDLLPHRAAHPVGQEVHLVHHDVRKSVQRIRTRVEHVAQHLGGHHHHRRVAVDRLVAGQQPDALRAVAAHQVAVLLVAQRLDRRGVEALSARPPAPGARRTRPPPSCPRRSARTPARRGRAPGPHRPAAGTGRAGTSGRSAKRAS